MEQDNKAQKKKFKERIKHNYRLVIMEEDTFREITSYRLTILNVYVLLSTMIVLTAALVVASIIFTPVKKYIPGYGSASANKELVRMNKELKAMEMALEAQKQYTDNFRKILVGDVLPELNDSVHAEAMTDTVIKVERIEEDEQLRQEVELKEIRNRQAPENGELSNGMSLNQMYFTTPVSGTISAQFDKQIEHYGVDILAPQHTPIKSIMDGVIIQSDWTLETGNTIGIQHADNVISFYKHNSVLLKKVGDKVKAGEAIAIIGNTGTLSDGPHLHLEIWYRGKAINPEDFIVF